MSRNRQGWNALLERAVSEGRARVAAGDSFMPLRTAAGLKINAGKFNLEAERGERIRITSTGREIARYWDIRPTPAPRQVRSDAWNPSKSVQRYRAFRDEVRAREVWAPEPGDLLVFLMPMPRSWSRRKRDEHDGMPHLPKPDADNLAKALLDACYGNDSHIWIFTPVKLWSSTPGLVIIRREPPIKLPFLIADPTSIDLP